MSRCAEPAMVQAIRRLGTRLVAWDSLLLKHPHPSLPGRAMCRPGLFPCLQQRALLQSLPTSPPPPPPPPSQAPAGADQWPSLNQDALSQGTMEPGLSAPTSTVTKAPQLTASEAPTSPAPASDTNKKNRFHQPALEMKMSRNQNEKNLKQKIKMIPMMARDSYGITTTAFPLTTWLCPWTLLKRSTILTCLSRLFQ